MSYDVASLLRTPVRQKKAYSNGGIDASDASWTATRCDSLIAALNARIELLKKDGAQYLPSTTIAKEAEAPLTASPNILNLKRRSRTTYAKRARRGKQESNGDASGQRKPSAAPGRAQGETWGTTPFLLRSKKEEDILKPDLTPNGSAGADVEDQCPGSNDSPPPPVFQPGPSQYQIKQMLKQVSGTIPPSQYDMSMRLCEAYQALLRAVKAPAGRAPKPSNSLLSMCLRAVSARMKLEQDLDDLEAKAAGMKLVTAARNLSSEMYSEIREMDLGGQGGKHIQTILLAHGTEILSNVIKEGLLCREFGLFSVMNCIQMGFKHEAEVLMVAIASKTQESTPTSFHSQLSSTTSFLLSCATPKAVYFRIMRSMFLHNHLPIPWLATKHFQSMWPRFYASLAGDVRCHDAEEFCKTVLPLLSAAATRSMDGICVVTTLTSLLSNLCSMVLLRTESRYSSGENFDMRTTGVLQYFLVDLSKNADGQQIFILVLLKLLVEPIEDAAQTLRLLETLTASDVERFHLRNPLVAMLSSILGSVLDRYQRADEEVSILKVKQLTRLLQAPSVPISQAVGVLGAAMASGIMQCVQKSPEGTKMDELKSIAHGLQILCGLSTGTDDVVSSNVRSSVEPAKANRDVDQPVGCRWEEGIGEWVAITPSSAEQTSSPASRREVQESPMVSYQSKVQSRVSFSTKRKHSSAVFRSQSFLDLMPSSPEGSDTEPESSLLTEITAYLDAPSSPREDHGFRAPPRKFRKRDSNTGERHELGPFAEDSFANVDMGDSLRRRTPFPLLFGDPKGMKLGEGSVHHIDSSGDELGY